MIIQALIVDDERLARTRIQKLLEPHDDVNVIGECKNGEEAVAFINTRKPDLIFLDVQMPDMDGFAVLRRANLSYNPFIVFATAFDKYALRAFDVHAIDYLLKPFDQERFDQSLAIAKRQLGLERSSQFNERLLGLIREFQGGGEGGLTDPIEVEARGRVVSVPWAEILWVKSEGNYVSLEIDGASHLYRSTLAAMEESLDPNRFLRIHRGYIINIVHVRRVRYLSRNNEYEFTMRDGTRIRSGRSYKSRVRDFLKHTHLLDD